MKERITFIHNPDGDFDAERLTVTKTSVQIKALKASREERLTLSPHELPQEVRRSPQSISNMTKPSHHLSSYGKFSDNVISCI